MGWLYDKAPRKRRQIKSFSEVRTAKKDHECTHCSAPIHATSEYQFHVYAEGSTLVAEYTHLWPECPK